MRSSRDGLKSPPHSTKKNGAGTADILAFCQQTAAGETTSTTKPVLRSPPPAFRPQMPPPPPELTQQEKETFHRIHAAPEHLGLSCIERTNRKPDNKTFHAVEIIRRNGEIYYYKQHNPKLNPVLPELEAVAWSFYHLVEPGMVPEEVNAHFNPDGSYDGISVKGMPGFKSIREAPLREEDLQDNEILTGLGKGLALSYFFAEEDLHTGNISKNGFRIDFDMSDYPILGKFKQHAAILHEDGFVELLERYVITRLVDGSIIDWQYRPYNPERHELDEYDIEHFPVIRIASPFYWVTQSGPVHTDIRQGFARAFPTSTNTIDNADIEQYKKLANISAFRKSMYKTFLKILLIDDSHFTNEAKKHIRTHLSWLDNSGEIKPIYASMVDFVSERKKSLRRKLTRMDEFFKFLCQDGEWAIKEIIEECKTANAAQIKSDINNTHAGQRLFDNNLEAKLNLNSSLFHTDAIRKNYDAIFNETLDNRYLAMAEHTPYDMFMSLLELSLMDEKQFKDVAKGYINLYRKQIEDFDSLREIADKLINRVDGSARMHLRDELMRLDEFKDFIEKQGNRCMTKFASRIDRDSNQVKKDFDDICAATLRLTSSPRM